MIGQFLGGFQALAETYMKTPVIITRKLDPALDPGNRSGDNDVGYASPSAPVMGWFVEADAKTWSGGVMATVTDRPMVRLPIGTEIGPGDRVTIAGHEYSVTDAAQDETYAIWVKAHLSRIE